MVTNSRPPSVSCENAGEAHHPAFMLLTQLGNSESNAAQNTCRAYKIFGVSDKARYVLIAEEVDNAANF